MRRVVAYLWVVGWMAVIFMASTDIGSSRHTSRIIGPFLRWLKPDVSDATISAVQAVVRKGGHITEYAILALLLWRARRISRGVTNWDWRDFWWVVVGCALYAASDEFHQLYVSSRQASPVDVMIDTMGAAVGLLVMWWLGGVRRRW